MLQTAQLGRPESELPQGPAHLQDSRALQVRLLLGLSQLVWRLVDERHIVRWHRLDNALCAKACAASYIHHLRQALAGKI